MTVFTPTLSLPLFSPSPSHSFSSLTFFCFYCYHCQRGLRKLPEFLSSYLPPPPLLFARGNHHRVIQDDFHSRSLPKRRSFLSRCFSSVPFFSLSLLLLFFSFLFLLPEARRFSLSLLESPLARRGLEIGLRIKCLKGIADTGKGRETILLRLTWALSFAVRNCVGEIGISAILHSDSLRNGSPMEQMTRINGDWRKRERERDILEKIKICLCLLELCYAALLFGQRILRTVSIFVKIVERRESI